MYETGEQVEERAVNPFDQLEMLVATKDKQNMRKKSLDIVSR